MQKAGNQRWPSEPTDTPKGPLKYSRPAGLVSVLSIESEASFASTGSARRSLQQERIRQP
jgi:hypothetical protein